MVDTYNRLAVGQKAEFFNPHMFSDGRWAVAIIFGANPELPAMWEILDNCTFHMHSAFFGVIEGKITLFIQ